MEKIIEVQKLNAGYGKLQILFNIDIAIEKGCISAILGPNGSGKSTLLKTVFGLTSIYGGSIKFNGIEVKGLKPHEIAKLGISYLPQVENSYQNLSVRENLLMGGFLLSEEKKEKNTEEALEFFPVLKGLLDETASVLSGGERQMLVMARALMRKPTLMMLDEPSANLSPRVLNEVFEKIKELRESGVTIVLVEQNTKKALEIAEYVCLLVSGRVNYFDSSKELSARKEFGRLFLGL